MDARLDGTIALNATVAEHFDRCLGCMACVSSCPSGVRYDRLIESTRATVEQELERSAGDRLVRGLLFRVLPYPGRMRAALRLAPLGRAAPLPRRLRPLVEIAPRWRGTRRGPDADPCGRHAAREGRPPHRLRAERGLPRRERRDGACSRRRRLRGRRATAGLLRRTLRARGQARRGEGVRASPRRRLRGRRPRRRQRIGLRIAPEGAGLAPRRRARADVRGQGARRRRAARRDASTGVRAIRCP